MVYIGTFEITWEIALEITLLIGSLVLLGAYHILYIILLLKRTEDTKLGLEIIIKYRWIDKIFKKNDVIPIQNVRNHIMVCSVYSVGILTVIAFLMPQFLAGGVITLEDLDFTDSVTNLTIVRIKLLALLLSLLFAFFNFTQSMKLTVHLGFLANIAEGDPNLTTHHIGASTAKRLCRDLTFYHWLGMRGFFFGFLSFLYLIGPSWLFAASVLVIIFSVLLLDYSTPFFAIKKKIKEEQVGEEAQNLINISAQSNYSSIISN